MFENLVKNFFLFLIKIFPCKNSTISIEKNILFYIIFSLFKRPKKILKFYMLFYFIILYFFKKIIYIF